MRKQLVKLGYSEWQANELLAAGERKSGLFVVSGPEGTRTRKTFRVFEAAGIPAYFEDIEKALEKPFAWLFTNAAPARILGMLERRGAGAFGLVTRRKLQLLCESCAIPFNILEKSGHDREDAEFLFSVFSGIDFSGAKTAPAKKCPECANAGYAVISEIAIFERPAKISELLSFGENNPEKSLAGHAASFVAQGLCDPAMAARCGGMLSWKKP